MCGCEHHRDLNAPCTCTCASHEGIRREMEFLAEAARERAAMDALRQERDDLAAAVDRFRRRHPRGDEEPGPLAPGLWCPTCGHERTEGGYGGCPDRMTLSEIVSSPDVTDGGIDG